MALANLRRATLTQAGGHKKRTLYISERMTVEAENAGSVSVDVSIPPSRAYIDRVRESAVAFSAAKQPDAIIATKEQARLALETLESAAVEMLGHAFATEFDKVVDAYRVQLHESLATGDDPALRSALNRARLQERILAGTPMADQAQACELLGLSPTNPSATMKRKEDKRELLRFSVEGRAAYPLFQFDVDNRRLFPAVARLIASKPEHWSDFRLLHWLTRPHIDMDGSPADALGRAPEIVIAAYDRAIEPPRHG